ncbi:MAG: AraC family transcriptional regulator, partial [Bacteroidota bacterium]
GSSENQLLDSASPMVSSSGLEFFEHTYHSNDPLGRLLYHFSSDIIQQAERKDPIPFDFFYHLAEKLILSQKKVRYAIERIDRLKQSTREELYRRALIAKYFIEEASSEAFDLNALSKQAGLSKYHLIRIFKAVFNTTPYHYYLTGKVERAKQVLRTQPGNLAQIAMQCGFTDEFNFSKTFKKFVGLSPSDFRERSK